MNHDAALQLNAPLTGALKGPINWLLVFVPGTVMMFSAMPIAVALTRILLNFTNLQRVRDEIRCL